MWDQNITSLSKFWYRRARTHRMTHIGAFKHFKKRDNILAIPVVILSTLVGTVSFASLNLDTDLRDTVNITSGIISLVVAMLSGVRSFLGWEKRASSHEKAYHGYGKICRKIEKELILQKTNLDSMPGDKFINELADMLEVLGTDCPTIPDKVLRRYNINYDVANMDDSNIIDNMDEIRDHGVQTGYSIDNNGSIRQKEIKELKERASVLEKMRGNNNFFGNFGKRSGKTPKPMPYEKEMEVMNTMFDNAYDRMSNASESVNDMPNNYQNVSPANKPQDMTTPSPIPVSMQTPLHKDTNISHQDMLVKQKSFVDNTSSAPPLFTENVANVFPRQTSFVRQPSDVGMTNNIPPGTLIGDNTKQEQDQFVQINVAKKPPPLDVIIPEVSSSPDPQNEMHAWEAYDKNM